MKIFGLIGFPLEHSFSKKFFTDKFEQLNLKDNSYENFPLEDISKIRNLILENPQIAGLNVTIPHKKNVIPVLDEVDELALSIGAVNTIKILPDKKLKGFNTDAWGFAKSLLSVLNPKYRKALILGNGGASLAIKHVLDKIGIAHTTVSRDTKESELNYSQLDEKIITTHQMIINCTPLGTFPDIESYPPIPYEFLSKDHLLYDLVYNPPETEFLKKGKSFGTKTKNGSEMLRIQAEESWKIWNDSGN